MPKRTLEDLRSLLNPKSNPRNAAAGANAVTPATSSSAPAPAPAAAARTQGVPTSGAPATASTGGVRPAPRNPEGSATPNRPSAASDAALDDLVNRINRLATTGEAAESAAKPQTSAPRAESAGAATPSARRAPNPNASPRRTGEAGAITRDGRTTESPSENRRGIRSAEEWAETSFVPREPQKLEEAGVTESAVEDLILKFLLARGESSGRGTAMQIKLPFVLIEEIMARMKRDQMVFFRGSSEMNDYVYQLTDLGRERARRLVEHCTYFGAAPVPLEQYIHAVKSQTIQNQHPTREDLQRAFSDLLINEHMFDRLGPAVNSGRGLFLYGYPGNGKTSIAERVTAAFGKYIWIPRALSIDGEIMRLFDPMNHVEAPLESGSGLIDQYKVDKRWVRVLRPTIVAGGELTMENLEVTYNSDTGISEAPLQLKSNCGTLVIDDFGRQKMSTDQLLNRWIVPLEKRYDFLNMSNGKKVQVPFDQLIVFSTNLEPKDLVDDAFLRRIPYKIEVPNPTESEFRQLFKIMCPILKIEHREGPINHLIENHYLPKNRPFRCCQPRDLLLQVRNFCLYKKVAVELCEEYFDYAVENYFAVMG